MSASITVGTLIRCTKPDAAWWPAYWVESVDGNILICRSACTSERHKAARSMPLVCTDRITGANRTPKTWEVVSQEAVGAALTPSCTPPTGHGADGVQDVPVGRETACGQGRVG